jgi:hypothetical protein
LCPASEMVITGTSQWNTNGSLIHVQIEANGAAFDVSFYRSMLRSYPGLVAKVENIHSGQAATAAPRNGSGLMITFSMGSAPSHGAGPSIWLEQD